MDGDAIGPVPTGARLVEWRKIVAEFQKPNAWRASWQLVNTVGGYIGIWFLIYLSVAVSWWLVVPLALLAGAMMIRVFIIFHDCGHGSFFASARANAFWGFVTGLLTFTPFYEWRGEHAIHHGSAGNLDRRGVGDLWTMTVQEYLESSRWKRFAYHLARNPIVLFGIAPLVLLLFLQRWPRAGASKRERHSVWLMNAAIAGMVVGLGFLFGWLPYLIIQLTTLLVAGAVGVWLFYLQHQFEDAYWERGEDWDYEQAAMLGSSFFKLPKVLQWFSGNIGFHHIHHLSSRIPNYNLERCHESDPMFLEVEPMTLFGSIKALSLRLWDESSKKLVGFRHVKQLKQQQRNAEPEKGHGRA